MSDEQEQTTTPKQEALRGLPAEWRERLIEEAAHMGIRADSDIAWLLVKSFINAWAAAAAAGAAAERTIAATAGIPDAIYQSTVRAGSDLRAVVGAEVKERGVELGVAITAAIQSAATSGAAALKKAAADLPSVATATQDEIIKEWRADLATAARDEARGVLAGRMARSWGMVLMSLALAFCAGAGGALVGARLLGFLLLHDVTVIPRPGGGQMVIFPPGRQVRQSPPPAGCPPGDVCIQN
ncbi:MAG: hypothetical protein ACYCXT_11040 [Acidiferrobacteraceae bacterium]